MYRTTHLTPIQQNHTALRLQHFKPLFRYNCSVHSRPFICSSYVPFCYPSHPEFYVPPCRSLCLSVKSACPCLRCRQPALANSFKLLSPPQSSAPLFWYFAIAFASAAIVVNAVAAIIITIFSTFAVTSHQLDSWTFSWFVSLFLISSIVITVRNYLRRLLAPQQPTPATVSFAVSPATVHFSAAPPVPPPPSPPLSPSTPPLLPKLNTRLKSNHVTLYAVTTLFEKE